MYNTYVDAMHTDIVEHRWVVVLFDVTPDDEVSLFLCFVEVYTCFVVLTTELVVGHGDRSVALDETFTCSLSDPCIPESIQLR